MQLNCKSQASLTCNSNGVLSCVRALQASLDSSLQALLSVVVGEHNTKERLVCFKR